MKWAVVFGAALLALACDDNKSPTSPSAAEAVETVETVDGGVATSTGTASHSDAEVVDLSVTNAQSEPPVVRNWPQPGSNKVPGNRPRQATGVAFIQVRGNVVNGPRVWLRANLSGAYGVAGVSDPDGIDKSTLTWRWTRDNGPGLDENPRYCSRPRPENATPYSTKRSIRVRRADIGKTFSYEVRFDDMAGNKECRQSLKWTVPDRLLSGRAGN